MTPAAVKPKVTARWTRDRHIRITAARGPVTTEATLTQAEAAQLASKLAGLLNGTPGPGPAPKPRKDHP